MPRADLGALLGKVEEVAPAGPLPVRAPELGAAQPRPAVPKRQPAAPRPKAPAVASSAEDGPTYLRFVRKEARLRDDQQNQLTLHARRLNQAKAPGVPRITDNTLIRVAVDLLLTHIATASGDDEAALLESLNH